MRADNWEQKLGEYIASIERKPFSWGTHDCALSVCDAALAMTGVDMATEFRGKYSTALSAVRAIRNFCGGNLEDLAAKVSEQFGLQEVPVLMAQRGDVCVHYTEHGPALGFVGMDGWLVLYPGSEGVTRVPLDQCERAWRVA